MMRDWFTKTAIYSEPRVIHTHAIYSLKAMVFDLNSGENEFVTY